MTTQHKFESPALIITRIFDAPRELVWKAWTDPCHLEKWWGPKEFKGLPAKIDLRVGGKFFAGMRGPMPDGKTIDIWGVGTYLEIIPNEKIVCTDSFADKDGNIVPSSYYGMEGMPLEMRITVTFEGLDGKTKMTLKHEGIPAGEHSEGATGGWNESFDKLAALLK